MHLNIIKAMCDKPISNIILHVMTNLDSILKSRDTTLLTKVHIVRDVVFPVVMCGCESWTIKTAGDVGEDSLKSLGLQGDPSSPS